MLDKTHALLEYMDLMGAPEGSPIIPLYQEAKEEVTHLRTLPEIVVLAGSSRFKQAFESEEYRLAITGHIVLGKHVYKPGTQWPLSDRDRDLLHVVQFRKVEIANRVHVINVDSYIGQDTYNLIKFAIRNDKPVSFLEDRIRLLSGDGVVTTHHFMQATTRQVEFEAAVTD